MIDTHCHIHSDFYEREADEELAAAKKAGVKKILAVGVDIEDSKRAIKFAQANENVWASVGVHPHDAKDGIKGLKELAGQDKVIAIGECGLDYWYQNSSREDQIKILRQQIEIGLEHDLPFIFHVRGPKEGQAPAFEDFFELIDEYKIKRAVVHSFTASQAELDGVLSRELLVGVNGIVTFSGSKDLASVIRDVPIEKMLLETDSPFLTPVPKRGNVNAPMYMGYIADFVAKLKGQRVDNVVSVTTKSAEKLFGI